MLIGYRDYIQDAEILFDPTPYFAGAPLSNAQIRQLAVVARSEVPWEDDDSDGVNAFFDFGQERTIGIVAILAHNFPFPITITIYGTDDASVQTQIAQVTGVWVPAVDSQFARNLYILIDPAPTNVRKLVIAMSVSSGSTLDAPMFPQFGRLWAGPVWSPEIGTARRDFYPQTKDEGVLNRSKGQQNYADRFPRFRQLTCTLPGLSEEEAIGTEDGLTQNLQDIGFEVGRTDPVIVIPSQHSNQAIHKLGVYGTFLDPPSPKLIEDASGRHYFSTFDVVEEL